MTRPTLRFLMMPTFTMFAALALFTGCAHAPPTELVDARHAYEQARIGPASTLVPAELHKAHEALEVAEASFEADPKGYETRDLAYVAQRSAQKASALAQVAIEQQTAETADAKFITTQTAIMKDTKASLQASEAAGVASAEDLRDSEAARATSETARVKADEDRAAADVRTAAALAALSKMEERGLVITLSGSVLFRSAEATLLPAATIKLDEVAVALLTTKERSLVIEGHTDAEGEPAYNLDLSQRRAEAVKTFLVGRGYDAALIKANGIGEDHPIADNTSPEGMANNRRVEIVVRPAVH
jgi:outer membrane protein OmpA-like peptidoglycan-associated protein